MAKRNLPRRLFKAPDRASSYQHDRSATGRMKHMAREHEDLLRAIETALVRAHRADPSIDDRAVMEAIRAASTDAEPEDVRVRALAAALRSIPGQLGEIPVDVWRDGLRVVADSVKRHSERRPGETSYLAFVAPYVK